MIWKKIQNFTAYDNFGIYNELLIWNVVSFIIIVISFILTISLNIYNNQDAYWISGCVISIYPMIAMYLSVPYVIKTNININTNKEDLNTGIVTHNTKIQLVKQNTDSPIMHAPENDTTCSNKNINYVSTTSRDKQHKDGTVHIDSLNKGTTVSRAPSRSITMSRVRTRGLSVSSFKDTTTVIPQMTHWSQIVTTHHGFELFINHLESEFSVENLLFITDILPL